MAVMPIDQAAAELSVSVPTLRRWLRDGAPVARSGRRGRGCRTLLDVEAVRAWRRAEGGSDALLAFAARVPELLAVAAATAHRNAPDKRDGAWCLCAAWQLAVGLILDAIRADGAHVPDPESIPEAIERLRKIAAR